ncbi:helix-turn-helix domain-containing protein [Gilvimarinus sp. SDUM040013]|uniref:Helix-turn-helix domain-containing protein n=1 Tax=Gilvimarinus gilvus TaxID=3058038 RepID=A0ABU4S2L7_9GAMM|nr:helix-turn-helix domain-containing protein [Gilvimarinus sp. SDUM040013]MDO3384505.1 helix-turn-helix domain-containing protein [Gilvimarinus sp. SDUM040013]MDX6850746.1 helix-turn-helix domain-containing protein [Gilvimarinus sp. SDUM040013]
MDTVLFNFHDLVLILTAFECLLFALLLSATNQKRVLSTAFFVGFLICHIFIPLHELTFWGKQFRIWLLDISPNLFFLGSYAYFVDGPLLYLFVRSLLYKDFKLRRIHLLHALPVALYFFHMLVSFYLQSYERREMLVETQHIAYSAPYLYFDAAGRFIRVIYAILCLKLAFTYGEQLKNVFANLNKRDLAWLKVMLVSFLGLFAWEAVLLTLKLYGNATDNFNLDLLNVIGLSGYYLTFFMLNLLIGLKFTLFTSVAAINESSPSPAAHENLPTEDKTHVESIKQTMLQTKIYTEPDITIDQLAATLKLPTKRLSQILKQDFHANFYEFINSYRVEDAKQQLRDPAGASKTITEIYYEVGFNSKSVFNTFFKRKEGCTPSQYRNKNTVPVSAQEDNNNFIP